MHINTNKKLRIIFLPLIKFCEWLGTYYPTSFARVRYFARFHKLPDLKNPRTLNEKILYMSLKTDTSLWTDCTDKYKVREYVKQCGLEDILVKLYGVWDLASDIDFNDFPEQFVLKATHGCGDVLIVKDKTKLEIPKVVSDFDKDLNTVYGALESAHHYMRIKPRMIAEELLMSDSAVSVVDYKIWCFNGNPEYIFVGSNRTENTLDIMIYDLNWKEHPEYMLFDKEHLHGASLAKPQNLEKMIEVARKLAKPFPCVRVDLYNIEGKIYFGELTFTSYGGLMNYFTDEFQMLAGSQIDLSGVKVVR